VIPGILDKIIIGNDPYLLSEISCLAARGRCYLPILNSPPALLPNYLSALTARNNCVARTAISQIFLADLDEDALRYFTQRFPRNWTHIVSRLADFRQASGLARREGQPPVRWGREKLALGLLRALRERREITFDGEADDSIPPITEADHLVVCEEDEQFAQVVAANYAYALSADLQLIPGMAQDAAESILDEFYSVYEAADGVTPALERLRDRLRTHVGDLRIPRGGAITFITRRLPYGFAYSEVPTTHLFSHPDLGISIVNALLEETPEARAIHVGVLVDPANDPARDVVLARQSLQQREAFVRVVHERAATVRFVDRMIEMFPYDLLLISTHCGDTTGERLTYEYTDSEGIARSLVLDQAASYSVAPGDDTVGVTYFNSFVSLDGVAWNDPVAKAQLYVGQAILDFMHRRENDPDFQPARRQRVDRVPRSAALRRGRLAGS
jgi:hypothetical protein